MTNVLYYINDRAKEAAVCSLCSDLSFDCKKIGSMDLNRTIGSLAGASGMPVSAADAPQSFFAPTELLVFCGISRQQLDRFLDEYHKRNIAPIALKAMMTPTNSNWTVSQLASALSQEHAYLQKRKK